MSHWFLASRKSLENHICERVCSTWPYIFYVVCRKWKRHFKRRMYEIWAYRRCLAAGNYWGIILSVIGLTSICRWLTALCLVVDYKLYNGLTRGIRGGQALHVAGVQFGLHGLWMIFNGMGLCLWSGVKSHSMNKSIFLPQRTFNYFKISI